MTTESITEYVERLFPTVRQISDPELRAKVVAGWERAWKASSWKRIEDCPKSPNLPTDDLVSHVNAVTNCALALADAFEAMGRMTVDRDILITAGLLHDISKLVEFEQRDGKYGLSEVGTKLSHAVYATHVVLDLTPTNTLRD
ncbi:MAG: HDIG domain-containing protein [Chloroflexi bacterium]|nr:HDIG domain-containing protein [Chloroflexota bacterium]